MVTRETMLVYGGTKMGRDAATGLAAADALLEHPAGRPTAIFCWRDEAALVAIQACHRRGLRVPEDISVVGFSDISAAWLCDPPLTTCQSPWEEMGRTAVRQTGERGRWRVRPVASGNPDPVGAGRPPVERTGPDLSGPAPGVLCARARFVMASRLADAPMPGQRLHPCRPELAASFGFDTSKARFSDSADSKNFALTTFEGGWPDVGCFRRAGAARPQ